MRTSLYSILCIVIRLGAVMLALSMLRAAVELFTSRSSAEFPTSAFLFSIGFLGVGLLLALMLWMYPGPLARLAAGRSAHQVFESTITAAEIQWVALSVLGMYWVMAGLLDLVHTGFQSIWMPELVGIGDGVELILNTNLAYHGAVVAFGIALTLGARGLTVLLQRLRYARSSGISES